MPSVSTAQQKLMGMAYALKKGDMDPADASQEVKDLADSLSMKQLKDFAETKHEGLPKHVEKSKVNEWLPGVSAGHKWYTQIAQSAASYNYQVSDHKDNLVKSYIEFIDSGKKPTRKSTFEITEDAGAAPAQSSPQATLNNTPGMGNVSPAGPGKIGSGDIFSGNPEDDDDDDKKIALVLNFDKFMKTISKTQTRPNVNKNQTSTT